MAKPDLSEIQKTTRAVIAKDKGYEPDEVGDEDKLRDDLNYDNTGLGALATRINNAFFQKGKPGLSPSDVQACEKVKDIADKVDQQPAANFK
jgi:hypothetical protein